MPGRERNFGTKNGRLEERGAVATFVRLMISAQAFTEAGRKEGRKLVSKGANSRGAGCGAVLAHTNLVQWMGMIQNGNLKLTS